MIGAIARSSLLLLQISPDAHYAGGATSLKAGGTLGLGRVFRFLFSTVPQWVQLGGIIIGVPVACIIAWHMWRRRAALWAWWIGRSRVIQASLVSVVLVVGAVGLGSGLYGYNYMMHQNDFCQSCHVMDTAWNRFQVSAHKNLQCHDCHRQPLYVSSKELFWWVLERRMAVPPHDKVPSSVCSECHMRLGTDSARTLVTLTAGHALHLGSTKPALKNIQCTTCHGRDFHKFTPNKASCSQSGCHFNIRVNLGAMSNASFQHCTSCHDFKGIVPVGATTAQARLALTPKAMDCGGCHTMSEKMRGFGLELDPHKGNCGMCHDVHKQTDPKGAFKTCATAQCHANAKTLTAFHRGLGPHAIDQCGMCHQAHSWKVKGTDCIACHSTIFNDKSPARHASAPVAEADRERRVANRHVRRGSSFRFASFSPRAAAPRESARRTLSPTPIAIVDSFPHSRHKSLACADCHSMTSTHGGLTFSRPSGCMGCHHAAAQRAPCAACHDASLRGPRAMPMPFATSVRRNTVTRPVNFAHAKHATLDCTGCHTNDAKRTVVTTCQGCHTSHHTTTADCATCHTTARDGHDRFAHDGCAACHTDVTVAALPSSRNVCIACHQEQKTHFPLGDCATCHALADRRMMHAGQPALVP
ncbi:MAG: cytochrome c3 family protein [bacterium]